MDPSLPHDGKTFNVDAEAQWPARMTVSTEITASTAFEAEAPRFEWAENIFMSMPASLKTRFIQPGYCNALDRILVTHQAYEQMDSKPSLWEPLNTSVFAIYARRHAIRSSRLSSSLSNEKFCSDPNFLGLEGFAETEGDPISREYHGF